MAPCYVPSAAVAVACTGMATSIVLTPHGCAIPVAGMINGFGLFSPARKYRNWTRGASASALLYQNFTQANQYDPVLWLYNILVSVRSHGDNRRAPISAFPAPKTGSV
jgi:hypothetical protein